MKKGCRFWSCEVGAGVSSERLKTHASAMMSPRGARLVVEERREARVGWRQASGGLRCARGRGKKEREKWAWWAGRGWLCFNFFLNRTFSFLKIAIAF